MVEHQGEDGRQPVDLFDLTTLDEVLVEQAQVGKDAHGHLGIDAALKFEQQVDVEPVTTVIAL